MKIGVSTLSEYENDKYDDPPMYTLRKIFKFYGLNFSKYFDEGIIAFDTRNYSDIGIKKATINHIAESKKKFDLFNENEENNDNKLQYVIFVFYEVNSVTYEDSYKAIFFFVILKMRKLKV